MPSRHVKCQLSLKFRSDRNARKNIKENTLKIICNISHENQYDNILVANAKSRFLSKCNSIIDFLGHFGSNLTNSHSWRRGGHNVINHPLGHQVFLFISGEIYHLKHIWTKSNFELCMEFWTISPIPLADLGIDEKRNMLPTKNVTHPKQKVGFSICSTCWLREAKSLSLAKTTLNIKNEKYCL